MTFRAERSLVSYPHKQGRQPGTPNSSSQAQGLLEKVSVQDESTKGRMGLAEGPLASIPWASNEVGPDSVTCNYSMKTFQGTHPLLSPEMGYVQPLPPAGYTLVA